VRYRICVNLANYKEKHAGDTITVWKVYRVRTGMVASPIRGGTVDYGLIKSNRRSVHSDHLDVYQEHHTTFYRGIHVCLTRERAREYMCRSQHERVFKCTAEVNKMVGLGVSSDKNQAVFMEIFISKKEFEKGIKGRN